MLIILHPHCWVGSPLTTRLLPSPRQVLCLNHRMRPRLAQSTVLGTQETCSEVAVNEGINKFGGAVMLSQLRSAFSTSSLELSGWISKCAAKRKAVTLNSPDGSCWWTWSCLLTQRNLMREAHERVNSRSSA